MAGTPPQSAGRSSAMGECLREWMSCGLLAVMLAGCAVEGQAEQPLSALMIRRSFAGGTLIGYENDRQIYIYFAPSGVAIRYDPPEYGQWWAAEGKGLCLYWR